MPPRDEVEHENDDEHEHEETMSQKILGLKNAVPYLRMFKGKTFVVKAGGGTLLDSAMLDNLAEQIGLLHQLNIHVVVVHGGGPQATEMSERLGVEVEQVNGRRVTNAETLDVAKMIFNGKINTDLLAGLQKHQAPAVGLSGVDGGLIRAVRRPKVDVTDADTGETKEVDFGYVGDVTGVDVSVLEHLLEGSFVPVVSALAGGENGEVYNVNADTIAAHIAAGLDAEKLLILTSADGVLESAEDPDSLISHMDRQKLEALIESGAKGGMKAKLEACRVALDGDVKRTHILNGEVEDSLLTEIFTNEGCGTLIVA
jgi:acetylglutamate kinase